MDDLVARRDVWRQLELLLEAMQARGGKLTAAMAEHAATTQTSLKVTEELVTESDHIDKLRELLEALIATFPDLPEDQQPKPN